MTAPLPQHPPTPASARWLIGLLPPQDEDVLCDAERLEQVLELGLHDPTLMPESVDALLSEVATELETPVVLLNGLLPDVQVLAAAHGLSGWLAEARATPVEWALCAQVVRTGRERVVPDLGRDPATDGNPLYVVDGLQSYAGVPVHSRSGHVVGALCVLDAQPRDFGEAHLRVLRLAAERAVGLLRR